jgi:hypothetical protein
VPFGGLIGLILATIVGSLVIGGLVFAVSHLIYLIILFPFVMGAIGGALLSLVVKSSKVRSPIVAALFGLILGIGIIGVYRFAEYYIDFRNEVTTAIREDGGEDVPQEEIDQFIDESLQEEVGSPGFIGYIKYSATLGTTISRTSSEVTLDETATWVYWGIELLIVALFSAGMAFKAARQSFNEEAGEWYPDPQYVGSVGWESRKEFYKLLQAGDTRQAFRMVGNTPLTPPRVDVVVQQTPSSPQTDVILTVRETRLNRKQEISGDKMKGVLPSQEFADLGRLLSSGQTAQPSGVQFSGVSSSLE